MKYERLTERREAPLTMSMWGGSIKDLRVYNRLAEYEDDEESGKIVRLHCKLGDTVYWLFTTNIQQEIYECLVTEFIYNNKGLHICLSKKCLNGYAYFTLKDIGKTVFLTREEAEKRLRELQGAQE